jgi:hypothetical protein
MIHRTSSSTHFLYSPFNSFLSALCWASFSLSLRGRFNGSGFSTVRGPFVTPSVWAGLWAGVAGVSCAAITRTPIRDRKRKAMPDTKRRDVVIIGVVLL